MSLVVNEFASAEELNAEFAKKILDILQQAITQSGKATLAVSGGSTPKALFAFLSQQDFPWQHVSITLADERWLDESHSDSNERLVKENLLVGKAAQANFVSLTTKDENAVAAEEQISQRLDNMADKFDIIILGMGEDGHTASLFPCSTQIAEGLNLSRQLSAIATIPATAPHQRMSMSLAKIINAKHVFLHLVGDKKREVLNDALANFSAIEKPIKAVCDNTDVNLMWAS